LLKVPQDGVAVNRPADGNQITVSTASNQYNNNPDGSGSSNERVGHGFDGRLHEDSERGDQLRCVMSRHL
jgi:hypothetical protein